MNESIIEILSESENFNLVRSKDPDGETVYHLELGNVTVHFFREEWEEFMKLIGEVAHVATGS